MDETFVGRQTELEFLDARLDDARRGAPRVVLVVGAGGVGKTALLRAFLARAGVHRLLRASGEELEAGLVYGVVEQLASELSEPLPEQLTMMAPDQGGGMDPLRIGAGIVDLLGRLQASGPVVVVVDDAHWADLESLQALVFALRRLRADRVLTLLTVRDDMTDRLPASLCHLVTNETGARLRLGGLNVTELRALGRALRTGGLSQRAALRLCDHTGGNALHAQALLEELPAIALQDTVRPLPAPRSFRMLVLARLVSCPVDAERLVVAAAVLGNRCPLALASRLAELDDPLPALEQAITAHLLHEYPSATELLIAFPHPLVRAAIYHDLGPARRAALHAHAARVVDGEAAVLRHRVAAASGADAGLAIEVAALARRQATAGAWAAAADNLLAAARLSATQADRERFVLEAVDHLILGGSPSEAAAFAEELATFADGARRDYVLGRLALVSGRHADATQLLARAWEHRDLVTQPDLAATIAEQLAFNGVVHVDGEQAVTWARRALAAAPPDPAAPSNLVDIQAIGLSLTGNVPEALRLTANLPDPNEPQGPKGLDGWVGRGVARLWSDDLPGALHDLTDAVANYRRRHAPVLWGIIALSFLAETEYRLGAWDDAILHAELAVSIAEDADQAYLAAFVHALASFPLAARGMREPATGHATAAAAHLQVLRTDSSALWVATAQALIALADNDWQAVATALEPIWRLPGWANLDETGVEPWPALHAEALVVLGRCHEAESLLATFEAAATGSGRRSALVAAARVRGTLEAARKQPERAEAAFRAGLEHAKDFPMPFEHGLLHAAYGRFLRRSGRRREAVPHFETARARFARLDAHPFLARCDRELAACGRTPTRRQIGPRATLTRQELAVARLVAAGRTNRQAAAELVVSVKTIEYHLGNAYAKLAVRSRTQLGLALRKN